MSDYKNYLVVSSNGPHPKKMDMCLTNVSSTGARPSVGFVTCTGAPTARPRDYPAKSQRDQLYQLIGNKDKQIYRIQSGDGKCLDPEGWLNTKPGQDLRKYKTNVKRAKFETARGPFWQVLPDGKLMNTNSGYGGRGNVRGCLQISTDKSPLGYHKAIMVPCDTATTRFKLSVDEEYNNPKADTMIKVSSLGNSQIKDYCLETDGDGIVVTPCLTKWREVPGEKEQSYQRFSFSGTRIMRDDQGQCYGIPSLGFDPDDYVWPTAKECGHSKLKGAAWIIDDDGRFRNIETGPDSGNAGLIEDEQEKNKKLKMVDQCLDVDEATKPKAQYDTVLNDCTNTTARFEYINPVEYEELYPSPAVVAERRRLAKNAIQQAAAAQGKKKQIYYGGLAFALLIALFGIYKMMQKPKNRYGYPTMSSAYYRR